MSEDRLPPRLSCVIPCFDEARNLEQLLPRLERCLRQLPLRWEVVLVDDGSRDDTAQVIEQFSRRPHFEGVLLSRNFGKEAALTAGLEAAAGDAVVLMDADGQHPPELVEELVAAWQGGADMVIAMRRDRSDESLAKRLATRLFYGLVNGQGQGRVQVPPDAGDFRLMDRKVVDALLALPERNRFMKGLYAWVGFRTATVPYSPPPREHGESRFTPLRLLGLSIDGLTGFTTLPLRAVSVAGLALALPAFVYGAWLVLLYLLYGHPVSGWTTIVVGLLFFSGIQLVSLGILGAYVARVFEEVKGRPLYVARRRIGSRLGAAP